MDRTQFAEKCERLAGKPVRVVLTDTALDGMLFWQKVQPGFGCIGPLKFGASLVESIEPLDLVPVCPKCQLPPLDEHLMEILGRPNFLCAATAQALRLSGIPIERKAEAEQANVLYWMLQLYLEHGAGWMDAGNKIIHSIIQGIDRKVTTPPVEEICPKCNAPKKGGWECECDPLGLVEGDDAC